MIENNCKCEKYRCYNNEFLINSKKKYTTEWELLDWLDFSSVDNCKINKNRTNMSEKIRELFKDLLFKYT